jgi:hypothetical protein
MKTVIIAAALLFAGISTATAQDSTDVRVVLLEQTNEQNEKKIQAEDLPAGIKEVLKGTDYKGWTVKSASTADENLKKIYKVVVTNGTETKTIKFDEKGQKLS